MATGSVKEGGKRKGTKLSFCYKVDELHNLRWQRDWINAGKKLNWKIVNGCFYEREWSAKRPYRLEINEAILKRYDKLRIAGDPLLADLMPLWNPNMQRLYYIYGGYWKAKVVSPAGVADPIYQSTNQSPMTTSAKVDLQVDDYMFLRPTQSEHVMLQFGDLLPFKGNQLNEPWPIFHQTG